RAGRRQRRLGQLLGLTHIRAEKLRNRSCLKMKSAVWSAIAGLFLWSAAANAHEIGTTRVSAVFEQGESYEIEVVTDALALVEKLDTLSGQTPRPGNALQL